MTGIPERASALLKAVFRHEDALWPAASADLESEVFQSARVHGILPVLNHRHEKTGCCRSWPDDLRKKLFRAARKEVAVEMARQDEIRLVLAEMGSEGIRPLLLKGAAVACLYYPAFGLRPRCDTDLLISASDRNRVDSLMKRLGYKGASVSAGEYLSTQTCYTGQGRPGEMHAWDVHWTISNSGRFLDRELGYARLIGDAVAVPDLGTNARTIRHADALLLACFHRAAHFSHCGDRLIWLYDIHLLARTLPLEAIDTFLDKASRLHVLDLCRDALLNAREWFGTGLDNFSLEHKLIPGRPEPTMRYLTPGRESGIKQHALQEIVTLSSWRERLRLLIQKVFPPAQYMRWRYGFQSSALLPFYYAYRFAFGVYVIARG